jgi:Outer membrane protein beta-barrel domain
MKKLFSVALFLFAASGPAWATDEISAAPQVKENAAVDFSRTSAASFTAASSHNSIWAFAASSRLPDSLASPSIERLPAPAALTSSAYPPAAAAPASKTPAPKIEDTGRENRWQIGLGVALVRFRSSVYYATAVGLNTSVSYFLKDSLAIEGAVTSAFAPAVFQSFERVKYVGYGAGPKYVLGHDRLQPWVHALVGGMHILPQTALSSQNGFELLFGGGADYALNPNWALRLEGDYLRTHVFGQWQNSGQAVLGIVYSF